MPLKPHRFGHIDKESQEWEENLLSRQVPRTSPGTDGDEECIRLSASEEACNGLTEKAEKRLDWTSGDLEVLPGGVTFLLLWVSVSSSGRWIEG